MRYTHYLPDRFLNTHIHDASIGNPISYLKHPTLISTTKHYLLQADTLLPGVESLTTIYAIQVIRLHNSSTILICI